ncbi:MAG TPA: FAD-linked oxidase C-terminal domain-containing protein [Bacteroidales bacterium]|nr:FAD-linked oxidase C-terminal domain-containing protein [Bacteroidales bacterium]
MNPNNKSLDNLAQSLDGEIKYDQLTRTIYSTDASMYKEEPVAVAWPKGPADISKLLEYAAKHKTGLIVRGAGTSLAGQVVGPGLIVDISRHMTEILEINPGERWVRVQPGVILDELNKVLAKHGLFFSPETSTANRCTMGGMLGNNACGLHSLRYGSTRDHVLEVRTILSDRSEVTFGSLTDDEFNDKCKLDSLEGNIYRNIRDILANKKNAEIIRQEYPDPEIPRRNTGYALDLLLPASPFTPGGKDFNFSTLIAGSEGTLAIATEIKLKLDPLPPPVKALCCVHLKERDDACKANLVALKYDPDAIEMMDDKILTLTKDNIEQRKNRFFLEGEPGSILIVEFSKHTKEEIDSICAEMIKELKTKGFGYAYPLVFGKDVPRVWALRKAGLGILGNMRGDAKPVSLLEDTAVSVNLLPDYIRDFNKILKKYNKECVYHAHIGTGELHLRPVLNLKDKEDVKLFHLLGSETALLVKKYRGSLSGEHGDGRLRGEFIPLMYGDYVYGLLKELKRTWDPDGIVNPGKITDTPPMDTFLRYEPGVKTKEIETLFSFSDTDGIMRAAEKCNGSGDCRKSEIIGGTMCPSYMATRDEKNTTRARANTLREFLGKQEKDVWDHREIYEVLDLCLSCKGCKSECPSSVDMARLKSEFMQHWYDRHGIPLRSRLIAYITSVNRLGSIAPSIFNFFVTNKFISNLTKQFLGFAKERSIPSLYKQTLRRWARKNLGKLNPENPIKSVLLFVDEFTNYNDTHIGIDAIRLLTTLNYHVIIPDHDLSARTFLSKGLVRKARRIAKKNVDILSELVSDSLPLIGIEPSAILGFRDEFPDLVDVDRRQKAVDLARNAKLLEEFIVEEVDLGNIDSSRFTDNKLDLLFHGHCQQKAVAETSSTIKMLSIPANYSVSEIPSGCCGMAGSFGYEKEHYDLSMQVGELVLLPAIRAASEETVITAPGTSCRHQIKDGSGRNALHPVQVLYRALKN